MATTITTVKPMLNTHLQFDQVKGVAVPEAAKLAALSLTIVCASFAFGFLAGHLILAPLSNLAFMKGATLFLSAFYSVSGVGAISYCLKQKKSFETTAMVASMTYAILGLLSSGLAQ